MEINSNTTNLAKSHINCNKLHQAPFTLCNFGLPDIKVDSYGRNIVKLLDGNPRRLSKLNLKTHRDYDMK